MDLTAKTNRHSDGYVKLTGNSTESEFCFLKRIAILSVNVYTNERDRYREHELVHNYYVVGQSTHPMGPLFRYKKNLKALYLVHPTNFIKIIWGIFKPLIR